MACPSDNLGSLLNGLNTILLGVMAILRHQTKADMHDNAAQNLQSLIVTVEFLRDDMTLCAHHPSYAYDHIQPSLYFLLYLCVPQLLPTDSRRNHGCGRPHVLLRILSPPWRGTANIYYLR